MRHVLADHHRLRFQMILFHGTLDAFLRFTGVIHEHGYFSAASERQDTVGTYPGEEIEHATPFHFSMQHAKHGFQRSPRSRTKFGRMRCTAGAG